MVKGIESSVWCDDRCSLIPNEFIPYAIPEGLNFDQGIMRQINYGI